MKRIILIVALMLLVLSHHAQAQDWIKIADKVVNFKAEKDEVTPRNDEKRVDKIRIKCTEGTVRLRSVHVEMSDGASETYDAKGVGILTSGMTSLAWDLPGKGSEVKLKKIELEYDAVGNVVVSKRARVEIQGRKVD